MKAYIWFYSVYCLTLVQLISCGDVTIVTNTADNVTVPDTTDPVVTLIGLASVSVFLKETYTEQNATAIDDIDGPLGVTISGSVDVSTIGTYIITYSATDAAGNTGNITRSVDVVGGGAFITTWKTNNSGASNNDQVKIGTNGSGYNYNVDWGDAQTSTGVTGDITHTYASAGTYTVSISGDFPQIYFNTTHDNDKLLTIEKWGDISWQSMNKAFFNCSNVEGNFTDVPDLSGVTDMTSLFGGASAFNQDIGGWNTSSVTTMSRLFEGASAFNQSIGLWDVSSVASMSFMFKNAVNFDQDIGSWNVSSVSTMDEMLKGASAFNQDISGWNTSSVTTMSSLFEGAGAFNQNLDLWDVSSVTTMSEMFRSASAFNQNVGAWNVSLVTDMSSMFRSTGDFNQNIGAWDVSSVTDMDSMFRGAGNFNQNIGVWNVSSVTNMFGMFASTYQFNQDIGGWDTSSVNTMSGMFYSAAGFDQNIGTWDVSSVTGMTSMFEEVTLSTPNYDALLVGWSAQSVQNNVTFHAGSSVYTNQAARDVLTIGFGWMVTDGGT